MKVMRMLTVGMTIKMRIIVAMTKARDRDATDSDSRRSYSNNNELLQKCTVGTQLDKSEINRTDTKV